MPAVNDLVLRDATVDGVRVDVSCRDGVVAAVDPAGTAPPAVDDVALDGRLVLAAPVEPHAHLDKAFTAGSVANPAGDLRGAIDAWARHHGDRTVPEIADRAATAVRRLVAAGVTSIRTHVDVGPGIELRAVEALVELRERLAPVVEVRVCGLVAPSAPGDDGAAASARLDAAVACGIDLVGGAPYADVEPDRAVAELLERAAAAGLDVDLHTDETLDPSVSTLSVLARRAAGFPGRITASHCCSLGVQDPGRQAEVAAAVADAGIGVVALPQTNLFLQARGRATAPPRGLTAVAALREAGVALAAGADNIQDPFCSVGRADPFETAALMVMAAHLTPPEAWATVTDDARTVLGLPPAGPRVGAVADLVAVAGPDVATVVADGPTERTVVRAGRIVARTSVLAELDERLG